jgi:predicted transcriptional regulator
MRTTKAVTVSVPRELRVANRLAKQTNRSRSGLVLEGLKQRKVEQGVVINDEYTPAQRRVIDREIKKGLADIKAGRVYGPFATGREMEAALRDDVKRFRGAKAGRSSRR